MDGIVDRQEGSRRWGRDPALVLDPSTIPGTAASY